MVQLLHSLLSSFGLGGGKTKSACVLDFGRRAEALKALQTRNKPFSNEAAYAVAAAELAGEDRSLA